MKKLIIIILLICSSCTFRGPITHLNWSIQTHKYGITADSSIVGFRIGTKPVPKARKEDD